MTEAKAEVAFCATTTSEVAGDITLIKIAKTDQKAGRFVTLPNRLYDVTISVFAHAASVKSVLRLELSFETDSGGDYTIVGQVPLHIASDGADAVSRENGDPGRRLRTEVVDGEMRVLAWHPQTLNGAKITWGAVMQSSFLDVTEEA